MAHEKRIANPVNATTIIERDAHESLRIIAFHQRTSIADLMRQAITLFLNSHPTQIPNLSPTPTQPSDFPTSDPLSAIKN